MIEKERVKVQGGLENETVKTLGPEKETVKVLAFEKETVRMIQGLGKEIGKVQNHEEEPVKNPTVRGSFHCYIVQQLVRLESEERIVKRHDLRILTVQESPQQH